MQVLSGGETGCSVLRLTCLLCLLGSFRGVGDGVEALSLGLELAIAIALRWVIPRTTVFDIYLRANNGATYGCRVQVPSLIKLQQKYFTAICQFQKNCSLFD